MDLVCKLIKAAEAHVGVTDKDWAEMDEKLISQPEFDATLKLITQAAEKNSDLTAVTIIATALSFALIDLRKHHAKQVEEFEKGKSHNLSTTLDSSKDLFSLVLSEFIHSVNHLRNLNILNTIAEKKVKEGLMSRNSSITIDDAGRVLAVKSLDNKDDTVANDGLVTTEDVQTFVEKRSEKAFVVKNISREVH